MFHWTRNGYLKWETLFMLFICFQKTCKVEKTSNSFMTKSVSFSCRNTPNFTASVCVPSASRIDRFRAHVSGPVNVS